MTPAEYRTFLIEGILEMDTDHVWTEEQLRQKPTSRLEVIYDTVGIPSEEIDWSLVGRR